MDDRFDRLNIQNVIHIKRSCLSFINAPYHAAFPILEYLPDFFVQEIIVDARCRERGDEAEDQ